MSDDDGPDAAEAAETDEDRTGEAEPPSGTAGEADDEAAEWFEGGADGASSSGDAAETATDAETDEAPTDADTAADDDADDGTADDAAGEAVAMGAGEEAVADAAEGEPSVLERIAELDQGLAEELADEVGALQDQNEQLRSRVEELERELDQREAELDSRESELAEAREEVDDLESRLKRKQADFQNYKKRAKKRQEQIKDRATEDLVERLIDVRDDLERGIEAGHEDVESMRDGFRVVLKEFDRILDAENVERVDPQPGTEVDPQRHEVMMRVDSDRAEGEIHEVYRPGYEMADKVLQAAQVTVSNGAGAGDDDGEAVADEGGDEHTDAAGDDDGDAVALGGEVDDEGDGDD
jgi:molecular chaperone GrpE